jgi:RimJ/RimL family protein N-acetyltransferase
MDQVLREGKKRGRKLAQITTFIGNDSAQRVCKRCGFRLVEERRCPKVESILKMSAFAGLVREL